MTSSTDRAVHFYKRESQVNRRYIQLLRQKLFSLGVAPSECDDFFTQAKKDYDDDIRLAAQTPEKR